eukprot:scaffold215595_cov68-Attheya_sp.AAC.1
MSGFGAGGGFGPPSIQRQGFGSASAAPPPPPQQQSFFGGTPAATAAPFGSAPGGFGANSAPGQQHQQQHFGSTSSTPSSMATTGFGVPTPPASGFGNNNSNASPWGNSSSASVSQTNHTITGTTPGFGMAPSFGGAISSTTPPSTNNTGSAPLTQFGTSANLVSMSMAPQQQPFGGTSSFGGNSNSAGFEGVGNQNSSNNAQSGFGGSGFGTAPSSSSSSYAFGGGSSSVIPSSGFSSASPAFSTSSQGQPQQPHQQLSSVNYPSGWGQSSSSSNAIDTSTSTADTMGGFGSTMGMDAPPFGGTAPTAAAGQSQSIVFGTSSNLAQPSDPSSNAFGGGFGSNTTNAGFGTTPSSSSGVGVGFGSSTTSTGFGTTASSSGVDVGFGSSTTSSGFGTMPSSSGGGNDSDGGMKDTNFGTNRSLGHNKKQGRGFSPVPEQAGATRTPPGDHGDAELAKLKARIQEKKRRLEEQRKKAQQESASSSAAAAAASIVSTAPVTSSAPASTTTSRSLNASAPAFAPISSTSVVGPPKLLSETGSGNLTQADKEARAIANAERFSNNATGRTPLLPPDLIAKSKVVQADIAARQRATMLEEKGGTSGVEGVPTSSLTSPEEDGEDATLQSGSLTGTCLAMCPDEELIRREMEGDIQLLETPNSKLHPADWNLRNTAVKRFRRSAADFKLNIPELIRPPDVLERVCGYLEEWVMVREEKLSNASSFQRKRSRPCNST